MRDASSRATTMRGAFAQLRDLAEPHRFRVQADAEGLPVIPGRYGQIEWYWRWGRLRCPVRWVLPAAAPARPGRLHRPSPALREALGHPRCEAPPDRGSRDAGRLPARGPGAGRRGDQSPSETCAVTRGRPEIGCRDGVQSDFRGASMATLSTRTGLKPGTRGRSLQGGPKLT
jgi:hypothetical protein